MSTNGEGAYTYEDYVAARAERDDYEADRERPTCGCALCFRGVETESGEPCGNCLSGAHQG